MVRSLSLKKTVGPSESEDEMDHASLYEEEMESEEELLEGDEKEEESDRYELPTLLAEKPAEEKAVQGWKVNDRAMEDQDSAISQWSIRETRDLMGDESTDENE
ncbi:hypothetical protein OEA41_000340 [Lepraria neglecta]|uniref:Uncharacterized protein n=1 Tax=Lepraria neglecta TaxID=209136 RepID=A0AAD9ZIU2_9LECA|nr:hypothetical protein OEA41_000340 [Lepraria neglecta]